MGHLYPRDSVVSTLKLTIVYIDEPLYPGQARNIALDRISDGHSVH